MWCCGFQFYAQFSTRTYLPLQVLYFHSSLCSPCVVAVVELVAFLSQQATGCGFGVVQLFSGATGTPTLSGNQRFDMDTGHTSWRNMLGFLTMQCAFCIPFTCSFMPVMSTPCFFYSHIRFFFENITPNLLACLCWCVSGPVIRLSEVISYFSPRIPLYSGTPRALLCPRFQDVECECPYIHYNASLASWSLQMSHRCN